MSSFDHSGCEQFLETGEGSTNDSLSSILRSDLEAELNQTVIDVQRTDSMMAE